MYRFPKIAIFPKLSEKKCKQMICIFVAFWTRELI